MASPRYRLYIVVTIIVVASAVLFFFLLKPAKAPVDEGGEGVLPENPPAGVSVEVLKNGERLVRNVEEGYEVRVENGKQLYSDKFDVNELVIQDFYEPNTAYGGVPGCRATISSEKGSLKDILQITKNNCELREDCVDFSLKDGLRFGSLDWTEIKYLGDFVGTGLPKYKTEAKGSVYSVYFECDDTLFIRSVLENFHLS